MIICFEDMETGKCLQEAPMGGKQYHLRMYAILLCILTIQLIFYVQYRLDVISVFLLFYSVRIVLSSTNCELICQKYNTYYSNNIYGQVIYRQSYLDL